MYICIYVYVITIFFRNELFVIVLYVGQLQISESLFFSHKGGYEGLIFADALSK